MAYKSISIALGSRVDTKMIFAHQPTGNAPGPQFGGINDSGYGREFFNMGMQPFVNRTLIRVARAYAGA